MGLLPPFRTDVRRRGARHETAEQRGRRPVRGHHRRDEEGARRQARHGALHRRPQGTGREVQGGRQGAHGSRFPHQPVGAALGRHHGRVPELDERTRHSLPQTQQHPGRMGYRSQRTGDGLREHGRPVGDRRSLHPRRSDRRKHLQRRIPHQRTGRGCRGRYPHPAADNPRRFAPLGRRTGGKRRGAQGQIPLPGGGDARRLQGVVRHTGASGALLHRHAGPRVHHTGRQTVDAPDA